MTYITKETSEFVDIQATEIEVEPTDEYIRDDVEITSIIGLDLTLTRNEQKHFQRRIIKARQESLCTE